MENAAIFPLFYLPPVEYISRLAACNREIRIDACEHFPKQTYRNRAGIGGPNGRLDLVVPVIRGSKVHTRIKDVRISNEFRWQRQHWMSLQTAYRRSSWFEFYEDQFAPFYEKPFGFLFDYNEALLKMLLPLLKLNVTYAYTEEYARPGDVAEDYRESIHPKRESAPAVKPYFQLFGDRNGFIPNLSVVDLLFSQGPNSHQFLGHV
jgi:hypothetical protein